MSDERTGEGRVFSVEEANAMILDVARSLVLVREARQVVLAGAEHLGRTARLNGGGAQGKEYWEAMAILRREVEAITGKGIVLRDPETGLIDFPAQRDGRAVFLCWRLGEEGVGFWHTPGSGFSGRRPL
jgi:hypothetical protein